MVLVGSCLWKYIFLLEFTVRVYINYLQGFRKLNLIENLLDLTFATPFFGACIVLQVKVVESEKRV